MVRRGSSWHEIRRADRLRRPMCQNRQFLVSRGGSTLSAERAERGADWPLRAKRAVALDGRSRKCGARGPSRVAELARTSGADPLLSLAQRRINVRSGSWDRHSLAQGGTRRASSGRATLAVWPPPSTQLYR